MLKNKIIEFINKEYQLDYLGKYQKYKYIEDKDDLIGVIIFTQLYEIIDIDYIMIKKEKRNKGYGNILLNKLIMHAKKENISRITLEVRQSNISAIKLYEKNNFKKVAIRKNYYKEEDGLLMILEL